MKNKLKLFANIFLFLISSMLCSCVHMIRRTNENLGYFALTLVIMIGGGLIINFFHKMYLRVTSPPDRKAGKYGTPYQFIGSDFIYQKYKNLLFAGSSINEKTTDIIWKFNLSNTNKNQPTFEVRVEYRANDIEIEVVLIDGKTTETKNYVSAYNKDEVQRHILNAIDSLLISHRDYK